uniref:Uncharacterized protein n=1 Tax=Arundo donax TaxID=35708 RepID=A0A0A8ZY42_ARUDO
MIVGRNAAISVLQLQAS